MEVRGRLDILSTTNSNADRLLRTATITTTSTAPTEIGAIFAAPTGTNITITLPPATSGRILLLKKTTVSSGSVTVKGAGASTVDTASSYTINANTRGQITLLADGTNWWII